MRLETQHMLLESGNLFFDINNIYRHCMRGPAIRIRSDLCPRSPRTGSSSDTNLKFSFFAWISSIAIRLSPWEKKACILSIRFLKNGCLFDIANYTTKVNCRALYNANMWYSSLFAIIWLHACLGIYTYCLCVFAQNLAGDNPPHNHVLLSCTR